MYYICCIHDNQLHGHLCFPTQGHGHPGSEGWSSKQCLDDSFKNTLEPETVFTMHGYVSE